MGGACQGHALSTLNDLNYILEYPSEDHVCGYLPKRRLKGCHDQESLVRAENKNDFLIN